MDDAIQHRLRDIKLIVFDCDGVLTDGRIYAMGTGEPMVAFNVRDGLGLRMLDRAGIATAVLSGRRNAAMVTRGKVLGMLEVVDARLDKGPALDEMLERHGYSRDQVAFMGDDMPDLAAFSRAHVTFCPGDAIEEVKAAADYVALAPGGHGAVREVCEVILKAQGKWEDLVKILADIH